MRKDLVLSPKGQVTLPKEMRDALGLKPGDTLVYTITNGGVIVTPKSIDFNDLLGFLGSPPKGPASLEDIDRTVAVNAGAQALPARSDQKDAAA